MTAGELESPARASAPGRLARTPRVETHVVAQRWGPLPAACALDGVRFQPGLCAPVKLVLAREQGAELWAEVPRCAGLGSCQALVSDALDEGISWLAGGFEARDGGAVRVPRRDGVEAGLAALAFAWEPEEDGSYRVHASAGRDLVRIRVQEREGGRLSLTTATAIQLRAPGALEALVRFALETNRRLRLARARVVGGEGAVARVLWDAVVPAELPAERALPELVMALACARAQTARGMAALADPRVAGAYLGLRIDSPRLSQER